MPVHLVKPEWVKPWPNGNLIFSWLAAETKVRMAIVGLTWLLLMVAFCKIGKKTTKH